MCYHWVWFHSLTVTCARLSDTCSYLMGHFSAFEIVEHAQPVFVFLIFVLSNVIEVYHLLNYRWMYSFD